MAALDALLASIRRNAKPGIWSQGVTLARGGAVAVESREPEEIVLRVRVQGRPVATTVVLYPGKREWGCDCGGRLMPGEHSAAAAIALGQGDRQPAAAPAATASWARLVYRFARAGDGLKLQRFIAAPDGSET